MLSLWCGLCGCLDIGQPCHTHACVLLASQRSNLSPLTCQLSHHQPLSDTCLFVLTPPRCRPPPPQHTHNKRCLQTPAIESVTPDSLSVEVGDSLIVRVNLTAESWSTVTIRTTSGGGFDCDTIWVPLDEEQTVEVPCLALEAGTYTLEAVLQSSSVGFSTIYRTAPDDVVVTQVRKGPWIMLLV